MQRTTLKILSIIPGTRYLGIAIFNDTDLREWYIKSIRGSTIAEKIEYQNALVSNLIHRFDINVITIKKFHPSRISRNLNTFISHLRKTKRNRKIHVMEFSIDTIEYSLLQGKGNKKQLIDEVLTIYPILFHEYEREKRNKNPYLMRMFEAVALGIVGFNQLDNQKHKVVK